MKILVPNSVPLPDLEVGSDDEVVVYDTKEVLPDDAVDADVIVVFDYNLKRLSDAASRLKNVKLVQTLSAGTDVAEKAGFGAEVTICSGVGMHDDTVAEHATMLTLALVRRLPQMLDAQRESRWAFEVGGTQPLYTKPVTTLLDANVLIWGFGSIGQTLAPILTSLGAKVRGVARSAGTRGGFEVIREDDLAQELPETDVLVMILPSTDATHQVLGADRLAQLPEHAYVVNVGRGTTVDEEALNAALRNGSIAGAALDVTYKEPLPEESPLWTAPNIIISPHAAGGRPVRPHVITSRNIAALKAGEPLTNVVEQSE